MCSSALCWHWNPSLAPCLPVQAIQADHVADSVLLLSLIMEYQATLPLELYILCPPANRSRTTILIYPANDNNFQTSQKILVISLISPYPLSLAEQSVSILGRIFKACGTVTQGLSWHRMKVGR